MATASALRQRMVDDRQLASIHGEGHVPGAQQLAQAAGLDHIGPGDAASPGFGCGNAIDIAVWKVTCLPPSASPGGCGR